MDWFVGASWKVHNGQISFHRAHSAGRHFHPCNISWDPSTLVYGHVVPSFPLQFVSPHVCSPANRYVRQLFSYYKQCCNDYLCTELLVCICESFSGMHRNGISRFYHFNVAKFFLAVLHSIHGVHGSFHFPPHPRLHVNVCWHEELMALIYIALIIGDMKQLFNSSVHFLQSLLTLYVLARLWAPGERGCVSHLRFLWGIAPAKHRFSAYLPHLISMPHLRALPTELKPSVAPQICPARFLLTLCPLYGMLCLSVHLNIPTMSQDSSQELPSLEVFYDHQTPLYPFVLPLALYEHLAALCVKCVKLLSI